MKKTATLTIIFCSYNNQPVFDKFILNNETFEVAPGKKIEKKFIFNKYEQDLDKKYCSYELITKTEGKVTTGSFDISSGTHIGYCFLDDQGKTFKILFLQKREEIKNFIKSKFSSTINSFCNNNKEIELSLNQNETEDRASLILINCLTNTLIKKDGKLLIDLNDVLFKIKNVKQYNGYQICYHFDNFKDFAYQKMEEIKQINLADLYNINHEKVDQMYKIFIQTLESKDKNESKELINNFYKLYNKNEYTLKNIINKKYVYGKQILEEDLNKECYFDFIFKILSFLLFEENISNEDDCGIDILSGIDILRASHQKLLENRKELDKDELLKVYEKILLLIEAYSLGLLYKDDYIIHYFHRKKFEKNKKSPLYYAYEFLFEFIEELSYESKLYYPLLSIDGGLYECYCMKNDVSIYMSTFGFNMLSLDGIKEHLKNMIPNFIIYSKYLINDIANTNPLNGNVILNINQFKKINLDENGIDENFSKHYAFIISKILIHEFFGHKKSSFSKLEKNYNSIISFRDENGEYKLINSDENDIFKNINEIFIRKNSNDFRGDAGYFIEYFLGKINNEYTISVIDTIENKTNLSKLLEPKLWHKDISTFKEYLKLKSIFIKYHPENKIDNNNISIYDEIELMKKIINENDLKIEGKESNENDEVQKEPDEKINTIFNDIWKKRKSIMIEKGKGNPSEKKDENEKKTIKRKNVLYSDFTHGFYRK